MPKHDFQVCESKIDIFGSPDMSGLEAIDLGDLAAFVTIGAGETHVAVLSGEARQLAHWTAVFGWSSLCGFKLNAAEQTISLDKPVQIERALSGKIRAYGQDLETSAFVDFTRKHLASALSYILDQTVGEGAEYDRIVLSAPTWLHPGLESCLGLRPHVHQEIQDA